MCRGNRPDVRGGVAGLQRVAGRVDFYGHSETGAGSRDFHRAGAAGRFSDGDSVRPGQDRRQEELEAPTLADRSKGAPWGQRAPIEVFVIRGLVNRCFHPEEF